MSYNHRPFLHSQFWWMATHCQEQKMTLGLFPLHINLFFFNQSGDLIQPINSLFVEINFTCKPINSVKPCRPLSQSFHGTVSQKLHVKETSCFSAGINLFKVITIKVEHHIQHIHTNFQQGLAIWDYIRSNSL